MRILVSAEELLNNFQIPKKCCQLLVILCELVIPVAGSFWEGVTVGCSNPAASASKELFSSSHTRNFKLAAWVSESIIAGSCPPGAPLDLARFFTSFLCVLLMEQTQRHLRATLTSPAHLFCLIIFLLLGEFISAPRKHPPPPNYFMYHGKVVLTALPTKQAVTEESTPMLDCESVLIHKSRSIQSWHLPPPD